LVSSPFFRFTSLVRIQDEPGVFVSRSGGNLMDVRRSLVCLLIAIFAVSLVPATARAADREPAVILASRDTAPAAAIDFQAAVRDAVATLETPAIAPAQPTAVAATSAARTAVRRRQGTTGMIIGLVSTLVGVAVTVYMVKEMKKNNDDNVD
jgi:hypothetical protein